jgi:sugar/nucleoside kinase (ribokinase family)
MLAGIVLSLTRGWTPPEADGFGMAAGAAALLRPGPSCVAARIPIGSIGQR